MYLERILIGYLSSRGRFELNQLILGWLLALSESGKGIWKCYFGQVSAGRLAVKVCILVREDGSYCFGTNSHSDSVNFYLISFYFIIFVFEVI